MEEQTKFCKHCGEKIPADAVVCTKCGRQVEEVGKKGEGIVINNVSSSAPQAYVKAKMVNKWVSFALCLFGGVVGLHKFYEGKIGTGLLYLCTGGLFCIGWIIDIFNIIGKPNPYAVH